MAKNANTNVFDDLFVPQETKPFSSAQDKETIILDVMDNKPKEKSKDALVQKGIYLTEKQVTAIKIKAATSNDRTNKDMSAIIRSALNIYLADELAKL